MGEYENVAAHNLKSIVLNLVSFMVFAWPFVAYFMPTVPYAPAVGVAAIICLLVPPLGWKRPHPYSDQPSNVAPMNNNNKKKE